MRKTLDEGKQLKLKFLNPLGVAEHLVDTYAAAAQEERDILDEDQALLRNVADQQTVYKFDKEKEFDLRMAEVENIFFEMEQRGDTFFEDRFRLVMVMDLIKKDRLQEDFTREVVADVPKLKWGHALA